MENIAIMDNIIRVIVFDDGYHDKFVVYENITHKYSFYSFINKIAFRHCDTYLAKTVHYEDLEEDKAVEAFDAIDLSSAKLVNTEEITKAFDILWSCKNAVEGIDVY